MPNLLDERRLTWKISFNLGGVMRALTILATGGLGLMCVLLFVTLEDPPGTPGAQAERRLPRPSLTVEQHSADGGLVVSGKGFQPAEPVLIYAAPSVHAAFAEYMALATVTARPDGTFVDANIDSQSPSSRFGATWLLVARGQSSGFMVNRPLSLVAGPRPAIAQPPAPVLTPVPTEPPPPPTLVPPPPLPDPNVIGQWYAEFYPTRDLMPTVVYSRNEAVLQNIWRAAPHPALALADFSARYTRREMFAEMTSYEFELDVDGAARVLLDGAQIIDEWHTGSRRTKRVTVPVLAGEHAIRVDFYNTTGPAMLSLSWAPRVFNGWQGRYYHNNSHDGSPVLIRDDANIDFNWDKGSPAKDIPVDNFSAKWERRVCFKAGDYKLIVDADDWVRVFINGAPVSELSTWNAGGRREHTLRLNGCRTIEVHYIEYSEGAHVYFGWEPIAPTPTS